MPKQPTDVLEMGFMLICNVQGDQSKDWVNAKRRFVDAYHQWLSEGMPGQSQLTLVKFEDEE